MSLLRCLALAPALALALVAPASLAQKAGTPAMKEYAADVVFTGKDGESFTQRVYQGRDGRRRMEMQQGEEHRVVTVVDPAAKKMFMLMPAQRMAMVMPFDAGALQRGAAKAPVSAEELARARKGSPCAGQEAERTCEKLGTETVSGRETEKWRITEKTGERSTYTLWLDRELPALVKLESPEGTLEMRNVKVGPQPASLFQVPKGYQVMQTPAMPGMPGGPGGMRPGLPPGGGDDGE